MNTNKKFYDLLKEDKEEDILKFLKDNKSIMLTEWNNQVSTNDKIDKISAKIFEEVKEPEKTAKELSQHPEVENLETGENK